MYRFYKTLFFFLFFIDTDSFDNRLSLFILGNHIYTDSSQLGGKFFDCPGIEIELTLHNDNTYTMNSSYMDRSEEPIQQTGNYTVKGNLLTLRAKVGIGLPAPEYYKVEENRLRRLNAKKQPITGELADQYVLTK